MDDSTRKSQKPHIYVLSQQNVLATCYNMLQRNQKCNGISENTQNCWVIHGFMLRDEKNKKLINCNNKSPIEFDISPYIKNPCGRPCGDLTDVKNQDPTDFFNYELKKHGSCFDGTHEEYVQTMRDLQQKYDMNNACSDLDLIGGYAHKLEDISNMLEKYFGKKVNIACTLDKKTKKPYLFQVYHYFDQNFNLIDSIDEQKLPLDTIVYHLRTLEDLNHTESINYPQKNWAPNFDIAEFALLGIIGLMMKNHSNLFLCVLLIFVLYVISLCFIFQKLNYKHYRPPETHYPMSKRHQQMNY